MKFAAISLATLFWAAPAAAELRVVASVPDLAAIAKEIGGDRAAVAAMALPSQDPHFVDARPHLALELSKADLLLIIGLDLELGWLPTLITGSRNGKIQPGSPGYLDCSTLVEKLEIPGQKVDRSMGDVHPGGNPHYLFDPRQGARVIRGVADRMAKLDPSSAEVYRKNSERMIAELEQKRKVWEASFAPLRGAKVIAYHKSFPYLAAWVGFEVIEHIEPRPGIPPNPSHVASVLATARKNGVKLILQESFYPEGAAKLIAEKIGGALVEIHGGTNFVEKETYSHHVGEIADALMSAWKKVQK